MRSIFLSQQAAEVNFFMMVEKFSLMGCEIVSDVSVFSTEEKLLKHGERVGAYSVTILI